MTTRQTAAFLTVALMTAVGAGAQTPTPAPKPIQTRSQVPVPATPPVVTIPDMPMVAGSGRCCALDLDAMSLPMRERRDGSRASRDG